MSGVTFCDWCGAPGHLTPAGDAAVCTPCELAGAVGPRGREPAAPVALYVWVRQFTGVPIARGYLRARGTNEIVWGCPHRHRSRLRVGGHNAAAYAERCAERELERRLSSQAGSASLFGCLLVVMLVASAWVILDAFPRGFGVEPWALLVFYGSVVCAVASATLHGLKGRR